jgi:hypothetical protein
MRTKFLGIRGKSGAIAHFYDGFMGIMDIMSACSFKSPGVIFGMDSIGEGDRAPFLTR